jgi:single-stranded DNA-binding protein
LEDDLNSCNFIGFFDEDPVLKKEGGVSYLYFVLAIHNYRKTKTGEKTKTTTFLPFEAWHTGADTIAKIAKKGTKITVQCTARTYDIEGEDLEIVFRVNEFDFNCLEENAE